VRLPSKTLFALVAAARGYVGIAKFPVRIWQISHFQISLTRLRPAEFFFLFFCLGGKGEKRDCKIFD
jgi:hypothetical protein